MEAKGQKRLRAVNRVAWTTDGRTETQKEAPPAEDASEEKCSKWSPTSVATAIGGANDG